MKKTLRKFFLQLCLLLLAGAAMAASLPVAGAEPSVDHGKRPLLNGTFIQLLDQHGAWSRARWSALFDSFQSIGLRQVVIQWTLHDDRAFFAGSTFQGSPQAPLETILQLAQARGMEVYLGLAAESRYWGMIESSAARQEEYLKRLRWKSELVAQELAPMASRYAAFKGWYIPEEIDDLNWRQPKSRQLLQQHVKQLSGFLKKLTPGGVVLLSAFCSARMDPETYGEFWRNLLGGSSVDMVLFQDGAGVGKLPSELLPLYLKALRSATDATKKQLQVVVELFTVLSESPFKAVPAPMLRVTRQLRMADAYASGGIGSFSVPDYMSPEAGAAAVELFNDYLKYKEGR